MEQFYETLIRANFECNRIDGGHNLNVCGKDVIVPFNSVSHEIYDDNFNRVFIHPISVGANYWIRVVYKEEENKIRFYVDNESFLVNKYTFNIKKVNSPALRFNINCLIKCKYLELIDPLIYIQINNNIRSLVMFSDFIKTTELEPIKDLKYGDDALLVVSLTNNNQGISICTNEEEEIYYSNKEEIEKLLDICFKTYINFPISMTFNKNKDMFIHHPTVKIKLPFQLREEQGLFFIDGKLTEPKILNSKDGTNTKFIEVAYNSKIIFLFPKSETALKYNHTIEKWEESKNYFVGIL